MNELNLSEGEHILYECYGKLQHFLLKMKPSGQLKRSFGRDPVQVLMSYGKFFITNNRIIAQGEIRVKGGRAGTYSILDLVILPLSGHSKRGKIRKDLPRDGHEIPINNIGRLRKIRNGITFEVMGGDRPGVVNIKPREMSRVLLKKHKNKLFELLSEFNKIESPNYARRRIICCVVLIGLPILLATLLTVPWP